MGLSISYPLDDYLPATEDDMGRLFIRPVSFEDIDAYDSPSALLTALCNQKLIKEGSLSFKRREAERAQMETMVSVTSPEFDKESCNSKLTAAGLSRLKPTEDCVPVSPVAGEVSPKHQFAAVKVQKVYKSFRTRRQLADCAVLVEQQWWKLLDFALLKRNSVSFFDKDKPETAVSRWYRARMRAAKVGKGLSKDDKAQKLALMHWLEAIDPRHRYGHNLHFYYQCWLNCESKQPFFYWLDIGEGKDVNLEDFCSRLKLQKQCIKYLGPKEREHYEVIIDDARMMYKLSRIIVDTTGGPKGTKWIFVLSTCKTLYIGQKQKGTFQHSSFLAGGATSAAGRVVVESGIMKAVWPHSGHYHPTEENFQEFLNFLKERSVDLTDVKLRPSESEYDGDISHQGSTSHVDLTELCQPDAEEHKPQPPPPVVHSNGRGDAETSSSAPTTTTSAETTGNTLTVIKSSTNQRLQAKRPPGLLQGKRQPSLLQGKRPPMLQINPYSGIPTDAHSNSRSSPGAKDIDQDSVVFGECLEFCKKNLFAEEHEEDEEDPVEITEELIMSRINSKTAQRSYQLGKQLSCRWSTGAGPRIGCVRDYPSQLQFRALEQVSLSPRGGAPMRFSTPRPRAMTPKSIPDGRLLAKFRQRSITWTDFSC